MDNSLEIGYVYDYDGSLHALEMVDLKLQYQGEQGDFPNDYGMTVRATNGHTYYIQVNSHHLIKVNYNE